MLINLIDETFYDSRVHGKWDFEYNSVMLETVVTNIKRIFYYYIIIVSNI